MKRTKWMAATAVIGALGIGIYAYDRATAESTPAYRLGRVERTSLTSTVSSTGTLSAVQTVQVGTQVSGQIAAINVDFNTKVKKGELLARIDPTLQQQAVGNAQAGVVKAQAQLEQAQSAYTQSKTLHDEKIITDTEYDTAKSDYAVSQANLTSARIALDQAKQNLAYTNIHAPIDGVVVDRNVNVGQTVAASLQAPQLFLIANDLSRMQILASVDESDIGRIKPGQPVTFTVQSYPNDSFPGVVSQVRLKDSTLNNVVSYTAVVNVSNPDGRLLPGMTATTTFVTDSVEGALTVPNAALRFTPPNAPTGSAGERGAAARGPAVWVLGTNKQPARMPVRTGLTDGQRTQVTGNGITDGLRVIIGSGSAQAATPARSAANGNPFQPATQSGGRGPRGPF
ncbi:MAG: efflux RND transporter periplasmic adaptor subunit [Gemmatimonadales bacterium]